MRKFIQNALIAGASVITLAVMSGAPAMAAQSAPATPVHVASVAQATDFADGDPDVVTIEPNITARPMCTVSGNQLCVKVDAGNQLDMAAQNAGPAENIKFNPNGNDFVWNGHHYHVGTLNMPGQSPACIGTNGINLNRQNCSTGSGIIWGHGSSNGHDVWINRAWTQGQNSLQVLGTLNITGDSALMVDWFDTSYYK